MYNTILKWFAGGSRTHDKPNLQWHINMYVGSTRSNAQLLSRLLWTWHCCHLTPIFFLFSFYLSWKLTIAFCSGTWELLYEVRKPCQHKNEGSDLNAPFHEFVLPVFPVLEVFCLHFAGICRSVKVELILCFIIWYLYYVGYFNIQ